MRLRGAALPRALSLLQQAAGRVEEMLKVAESSVQCIIFLTIISSLHKKIAEAGLIDLELDKQAARRASQRLSNIYSRPLALS